EDDILRCSGCQVVYYCGRDHQTSDRASHKKWCQGIKKARTRLEREEQNLRDQPPSAFTPPDIFETGVGHFWGINETRPYMRARYHLGDSLLNGFSTIGDPIDAVQTTLDHFLDMMRLCRGDNLGLRNIIPGLFIRLGRDQEAYDFAKWYVTGGDESNYNWGDIDLPFLDLKGANVLEPPGRMWTGEYIELSHAVAVTLVKVRVLLDLQAIQNATRAFTGAIPQEIIDLIRGQLVSNVVESRPYLLKASMEETTSLIEAIKQQVRDLHLAIDENNYHFWPIFLADPISDVSRPNEYSPGSREEAILILCYTYPAWAETPGAVELIRIFFNIA
ncbi:hypothetical protein BKA56DRAFT_689905, partial [Ilyonectria sp. MPI-CAGE-AT-0026]